MDEHFIKLYPTVVCYIFTFMEQTIKYHKDGDLLMELCGYFKHDKGRSLYYLWENVRLYFKMPPNNTKALVCGDIKPMSTQELYDFMECCISDIKYIKNLSMYGFYNILNICKLK